MADGLYKYCIHRVRVATAVDVRVKIERNTELFDTSGTNLMPGTTRRRTYS